MLSNAGTGTYGARVVRATASVSLVAADLDGDLDPLGGSTKGYGTRIDVNEGALGVAAGPSVVHRVQAAGDLDGDGDPDAVGDGLRCAGGAIVRLGVRTNSGGASQYPSASDLRVSTKGFVTAPGERVYQVWHRDVATYCTPRRFNLSNGVRVRWAI